jgi:hypothetical protein
VTADERTYLPLMGHASIRTLRSSVCASRATRWRSLRRSDG